MLSRRSFLMSTGAGVMAGTFASQLAMAAHHIKIPLGIQLYTVRAETDKDVEGTLKAVAAAGYTEIEFAGYYGRTASEINALFKTLGLTGVSSHVGANDIANRPGEVIAMANALGLKYLICSSPKAATPEKERLGYSEKMNALDLSDWKANAELFNKFGKQAKANGLQFGYHNHHVEFHSFDGVRAYDKLLEWSDPDLVKMQLDVGWAAASAQDSIAILKKWPGRFVSLHVKDILAVPPKEHTEKARTVEIGKGLVDWKAVISAAHAAGVKHYFVEQEPPYAKPILESIVESANYMKALKL